MKCPKCNYKNPDGVYFCRQCGQDLLAVRPGKEKKTGRTVMISALAVLALCLIGGGAVLGFSGVGSRLFSSAAVGTEMESGESGEMEEVYQNGLNEMENGNYESAISAFIRIPDSHRRYADAQKNIDICAERYADSLLSEIRECKNEKDFAEVYAELVAANNAAFAENIDLQEKLLNLQNSYEEFLLAQIKNCKQNDDYVSAFLALSQRNTEILPESAVLTKEENALKTEYRAMVLAEAEDLMATEGSESAVKCLSDAEKVLPGDAEINAKIKEYSECQPIRLYDMDYFCSGSLASDWSESPSNTDSCFYRVGNITDNLGNEYFDGIKTSSTPSGSWETYIIDGKYSRLSGSIIIDEDHKSTKRVGYVKILGDGMVLYTSPKIEKGMKPVSFDVDLTGVDELTIQMVRDWNYNESHFALVNCNFEK